VHHRVVVAGVVPGASTFFQMKRDADRLLGPALAGVWRAHGFAGTLPHWRREVSDGEAWLAAVEHDHYGGGFRVALAWMPPRRLFPTMKRPRRLVVTSLWPDFRVSVPTGKFVRYENDLSRAVRRVVSAVDQNVPSWFLRNQAIAKRLGPRVTASTLSALLRERFWIRQWMSDNESVPGCLTWSRAALAKATDAADRASLAWRLAKHGDRKARALLVELLDDPGVQSPAAPIRAAQALADIHGWRFRWDLSSVASVKRKLRALDRSTG
jgi:hypothetical protein